MSNSEEFSKLHKALTENSYYNPPNRVRVVANKRSKYSSEFGKVSHINTEIVDRLVNLAENLADNGKGSEAKEIVQIIRILLDNNNRLQQVVSKALKDI